MSSNRISHIRKNFRRVLQAGASKVYKDSWHEDHLCITITIRRCVCLYVTFRDTSWEDLGGWNLVQRSFQTWQRSWDQNQQPRRSLEVTSFCNLDMNKLIPDWVSKEGHLGIADIMRGRSPVSEVTGGHFFLSQLREPIKLINEMILAHLMLNV